MLICYPPKDEGKPVLKVDFVDFGFINKCNNFFVDLLSRHYTVVISDRPDILIYSDTGNSHLHRLYNCKRIFWTGESTEPDFNVCDYALTPRTISNPRHCRLPYYVIGCECDADDLIKKPGEAELILSQNRHGCGVVVSNMGKRAQYRTEFFHTLGKHISVFSGGRSWNNIGGPIAPGGNSKHEFLRKYRFNQCFENKSLPGYTTEKIVEAMWARCIPIYWGEPDIGHEFNPKSFVNLHDFPDEDSCLQHILEIENNNDLYLSILREPYFFDNLPNIYYDMNRYSDFLCHAVEEDMTPASKPSKLFFSNRWRLAKRMH
jgi:hypothetical protein